MKSQSDGPLVTGPIFVIIRAIYPLPRSEHRVRSIVPRRWRTKLDDVDNIAKAVLDAAKGVLWDDDARISRLIVDKFTAAQDEEPRVEIEVGELPPLV